MQYYCTKERWASPVGSDDATVKLFRPALAQTNFEKRGLKLAFDATRDGWSAEAFHAKLDFQGPAVVFCRTTDGSTFGGYNPKGWVNYGEYRGSLAAFLYCWPDGADPEADLPTKLAKVGGAILAQMDDGSGPKFGADSLVVPLGAGGVKNPRVVRVKLGSYYERLPGGRNSFLTNGAREAELAELKVYTGVYAPGEYVPFTDAEPFALS